MPDTSEYGGFIKQSQQVLGASGVAPIYILRGDVQLNDVHVVIHYIPLQVFQQGGDFTDGTDIRINSLLIFHLTTSVLLSGLFPVLYCDYIIPFI